MQTYAELKVLMSVMNRMLTTIIERVRICAVAMVTDVE